MEAGDIIAATSDFVIYSAILEIESKSGKKESETKIATFLAAISSLAGLSIIRPTHKEMIDVAEKMGERKFEFRRFLRGLFYEGCEHRKTGIVRQAL
jgi:hypothetical protein